MINASGVTNEHGKKGLNNMFWEARGNGRGGVNERVLYVPFRAN
jgi:hypothetical protein